MSIDWDKPLVWLNNPKMECEVVGIDSDRNKVVRISIASHVYYVTADKETGYAYRRGRLCNDQYNRFTNRLPTLEERVARLESLLNKE